MHAESANSLDSRRRRWVVRAATRWASVAVGLLTLVLVADRPETRWVPGLLMVAGYAAFNLASQRRQRSRPDERWLKAAHEMVDALAIGAVSAVTGGSRSPVAFILFPHVVAASMRGGLRYAVLLGAFDAGIMAALAWSTPGGSQGTFHALALLACAVMGGTASSHLHEMRRRLRDANVDLAAANEQLHISIDAATHALSEQERALDRLWVSEERYRHLLERIQDGVLIIQDGRVAYCNEVFAAMVGAPRAEIVGRGFVELAPLDHRTDLAARYARWEADGAPAGQLESRLRTTSGETRMVSLRAGSADYEGRPAMVTTVRDVTRERTMEADLKAHAERLAALNEIANAVNLNLTIEDILTVAGDEARRLVPFDALSLALVFDEHPDIELVAVGRGAERRRLDVPRREIGWAFKRPAAWCSAGQLDPPQHFQALFDEDGIESFASLPLFSKGRAIGSLNLARRGPEPFSAWDLAVMEGVARHIAIALGNARLLEAVRRHGREFESLLDISRGILERLDLETLLPMVTRSVNCVMGTTDCLLLLRSGHELRPAAHEGLEPEVVAGFSALRVGTSLSGWVAEHGQPLAVEDMRSDARTDFREMIERHGFRAFLCVPLKHGDEVLGTLEVVTREPRRFTVEEQVLMSAFADQAAVAIANARLYEQARSHLAEVTRANERLEDLDRQRQEYLRNVSHEFRTPLTVIKGYAEYLRDAGPGSTDVRAVMRVVLESCERLIDMVDTLIEINRVEQCRAGGALQVQHLELRALTETAIEPLRATAERKGLALELQFPPEPLRLTGEPALLGQVVRKLVDNALKYSGGTGRVVVRGRRAGDELLLEVEDRGIGIAAEHLPRIFDKFYMVEGGLTRRVGGTGVGLYLVREIVRLHDGHIDVTSVPGQGSVFRVHVPAAPPRDASPVHAATA